ncbi:MAG: cupin domain-containing protein [Pseudomonadota bacterium]
MAEAPPPAGLLRAAQIEAMAEERHQHQFNPNAVRMTRSIGDALGLTAVGVHLVRLAPGRDSTQYHYHETDEEFLYILSGRGIAELGEHRCEIGPGDFMAFPAGSEAHLLHNPFDEDLVYLMGGDRNPSDLVHYPRIGRSMIKSSGGRRVFDTAAMQPVEPPE